MGYWKCGIIAMIVTLFHNILSSNTDCRDKVYMKIPYNGKLINNYSSSTMSVVSAYKCLELCRNDALCKSVGIDTSSMTCYLYDGRVYAGLPGTVNTDIIYYWQLEAECPIHLEYNENSTSNICSKVYIDKLNWTDAQQRCEMDGGHLFLADTPAKRDILVGIVLVGSTDFYEEDVWNWLNGVPVDRNLFKAKQPSNTGNAEHCLQNRELYKIGLNDMGCHAEYGFICEVPTNKAFQQ